MLQQQPLGCHGNEAVFKAGVMSARCERRHSGAKVGRLIEIDGTAAAAVTHITNIRSHWRHMSALISVTHAADVPPVNITIVARCICYYVWQVLLTVSSRSTHVAELHQIDWRCTLTFMNILYFSLYINLDSIIVNEHFLWPRFIIND